MLKRRLFQFALMAGLCTVFAVPGKAAMTITYTATITPQDVPFSQPVSLNQFDTHLGTLQSVTLSIMANGTATVSVLNFNNTNTTKPARNFSNATASVPVSITGPDGLSASSTLSAGPFSGTVGAAAPHTTTEKDITGPGTAVLGSTSIPTTNFSFYEGSGRNLLTFSFDASDGSYGGTGTGVSFGGDANVGADVTIAYTYIPRPPAVVPEPSTIAALASGLVCLGLVRLRRKSA